MRIKPAQSSTSLLIALSHTRISFQNHFEFFHLILNSHMGFRLPGFVALAKQGRLVRAASKAASASSEVPKGFCSVYVGETQMKRFLVPIFYLNQPPFQDLLSKAEEEFGFSHPMGGLTIPCREDVFVDVISSLNGS